MKNSSSVHYSYLLLMAILSFISMYILMYMMVDKLENVYSNLNQFYMAGIMTAPMIVIELFLMQAMYPNKWLNAAILSTAVIVFALFIFSIRNQTVITDKEFLKSMIPHHGGAILMCEKAHLKDPDVKALCRSIISSQQSEIDYMKKKLNELKKSNL